jgi:hypothetical protein
MIETIMTKFQGVSRWLSGGEVLEQNGQLLDARCVLNPSTKTTVCGVKCKMRESENAALQSPPS